MRTYTYSEARQRLATLLDEARREGKVQIRRRDGSTFILQPVVATQSPLDVPGVRSSLRRGELVDIIREERKAAGERIVDGLSNRPVQPMKGRRQPPNPPKAGKPPRSRG